MARKPYTADSLARALDTHKDGGWIHNYVRADARPEGSNRYWLIDVVDYELLELTEAQVYAFCVAMRSAQVTAERRAAAPTRCDGCEIADVDDLAVTGDGVFCNECLQEHRHGTVDPDLAPHGIDLSEIVR